MPWKCATCGVDHDDLPTCFGCEAPWRELVAESEFESRVELTRDQCVIDGSVFFVRGHLEIPIAGHPETLALAVWSSLSEQSFCHMCDRWDVEDRHHDPAYFGWLSSRLPVYPDTVNLKLSVQTSPRGSVPQFTTEQTDHPLSVDQHHGISIDRWREIAHGFMEHFKVTS
jgi:hypothetical protein